MLVSVEEWSKASCHGSEVEFVAIQLEHFGFMLSRAQAEEYCRKLIQLRRGDSCHTDEGDTLFMDLDTATYDAPFVIVSTTHDAPNFGWFCDIPEPAADELFRKLKERLRDRNGQANTVAQDEAGLLN